MPAIVFETSVVVGLMIGALALWTIPDGRDCPDCPHCQRKRADRDRVQLELRHDVEHRGFGFRRGDPDRFACPDPACPRNPRSSERGGRLVDSRSADQTRR
jgi:hypothetical protein